MSIDPSIILAALANVLQPWNIVFLVLGVIGGLLVGIVPGLGPTLAVALLIPVTYAMPPEVGLSLLIAVYVGGMSGGFVTAVLIRIPGTPASMATLLDGFPMAQKGQAGAAIGNAIVANFIGTIISAICLVTFAPLLAAFALKFSFAEYTAVCLFAMTAVAAITGSSASRGFITAVIGMLAACVGLTPVDGLPRFDFGFSDMEGGLGLLPALIGLFAVSQMMKDSERQTGSTPRPVSAMSSILPSFRDMTGNAFNYLRSGLIGTWVGVMPAMGGGPAALIAYAQARNASKTPERFGHGAVEGVIASETANNATIGGGLIIALTLGIPGDPTSAVLLGGLMIHGLQPGPQLFLNNPEVLYGIYFSLFFSSFIMMLVLFLSVRALVKVIYIPRFWLQPILIAMCVVGVYSLNNRIFDIGVMFAFGLLGYVLERLHYPLPPMVLGIVLGPLLEANFRKMLAAEGSLLPLVESPIALTFVVLSVASLVWAARLRRKSLPEISEKSG
ncbi:MAG: tripartite tricarboxylate transporter permease [Rhodospirillales bacterium]|nr:tripartite tricarboxylate transporter permease [Rhodospirillales bacterium]